MGLGHARPAASSSRSAGRYRWVILWLAVGCVIALLLVANAVRDYRFVARLLGTQGVRHHLTQISSQVEAQLRRGDPGLHPLQAALGANLRPGESVTLRDSEGALLEHLGPDIPTPAFSLSAEHEAFAHREPLYRIIASPFGDLVLEAFSEHPSRKPGVPPPGSSPDTAGTDPHNPGFFTLEVALPLQTADAAVLKPIRRNLTINLAAALALLSTVVLAGVGLRSYAKGAHLEEQVEIARQVQSRLLPDPALVVAGLELATVYKPSEQVGGDFYDVFAADGDQFAAVIGDVSGKGLPAALLMGVIHGAVRTSDWRRTAAGQEHESARLNQLLCDRASGNRFASMFWCAYDRQLASMRYVNAGHCPPLLVSQRNDQLTVQHLGEGGPVLGLLPLTTYTATTVNVRSGDLLVMYSDGLVEAVDATDEEYGEARLEALLRKHCHDSATSLRETLMASWNAYSPPGTVHDDLTLVIIRF